MEKIHDLRSFLKVLKDNNQIITINKEINIKWELGSILATLERMEGEAIYFSKIKGYSIPVVGGLLASHKRIALALECKIDQISEKLENALSNPIKPIVVNNPSFMENVLIGEQVNLNKIPIPIHAPKDGGPFITAGVTVSKDFNNKRQNLSFQRLHIKSNNKTGIMINEWRHLKEFLDKAETANKPLPIAVVVGVDPTIMIAAGIRYEGDETEIAGGIRGRAIEIAKCHSCDIYVPANAEFVIEGEIIPKVREEEGPLAEFTGHYGNISESPVFKIKAICYRNNPIWQTLNGGSFEHINLGNVLPREPLLKKFTTYVSKNVKNVYIPPYGSGFLAIISLEKKNPGEAKNVAMAAMTSHVNIKNVIIVDPDVDIYNPAEIMWALSTRVDPKKDIFYIPYSQGHELDPASDERGVQTKMGIDATLWEEKKNLEKVIYKKIDLNNYI